MSDPVTARPVASPIPAMAGIGLRAEHYEDVLAVQPDVGWVEVHSENYFGEGGAPLRYLEQVRTLYPLSLHGIGSSLGSADALSFSHLTKLRRLIDRFEPGLVSEHLCWSSVDGRFLNDLLPLPYTEEALAHVVARIATVQEFLGREILIENLSSYLQFEHSAMPEWEFLDEVARRSGCGILLDVNNIYVSAKNHDFDPIQYIDHIARDVVHEIHLAGHSVNQYPEGAVLIDTHNTAVCDDVWALYEKALARFGRMPTLIEWDTDLPSLSVLVSEAHIAQRYLERAHALVA